MPFSRKLKTKYCEWTGQLREVPDFLIVGTSFCAKTLLYHYLVEHPQICENLREETGYFLNHYDKGINWYKSNFPSKIYKIFFKLLHGTDPLVGETVNLPGTLIPKRISKTIPNPKIILILRNPVDRAYTRYLAMKRKGLEELSFEDAIENETEKIGNNEQSLINEELWPPRDIKLRLYMLGGIYVEFLESWAKFFPKEKMLVISTECLFNEPLTTVNIVLKYLGLSTLNQLEHKGNYFEKDAISMNPKIKKKLEDYFRPYNKRLYNFLGKEFGWDDNI